ncbi:MAG: hypothetical protein IJH34_17215 [Romboutsia sp.]|nr:hypothetical protein [Romboutsia sp.]
MEKLLELNVSTNFLIDNTIEFDIYKKLALSKNTIILLDNANTEERYRLLANYVLKTN